MRPLAGPYLPYGASHVRKMYSQRRRTDERRPSALILSSISGLQTVQRAFVLVIEHVDVAIGPLTDVADAADGL